jgi:predicted nuclease of predicted toxin-antitoxin system
VGRLLIDECLHASLLDLAHTAGYAAEHVNYLGLRSSKDWELKKLILEADYTLVANNGVDFLTLYRQAPLDAGLIINFAERQNRAFSRNYSRRPQRY